MTGNFNAPTITKLNNFRLLIEKFTGRVSEDNAYDIAVYIAQTSGIVDDLSVDSTPEGISRKENIQELLNAIKDFSETAYKEGANEKLPAFLEGVALLTDQDSEKAEDNNKVTLMTIHAAKGLEFPNVFMTGIEEELFPAQQSTSTPSALEEERRLFYVALTRAEKRVVISYANSRYRNGQIVPTRPSRFISEIDPHYVEGFISPRNESSGFRLKTPVSTHKPTISLTKPPVTDIPELDRSRLKQIEPGQVIPGMIIFHPTFGTGKVIALEGLGVNKKAKVLFTKEGNKTLLLKFAKIYTQED